MKKLLLTASIFLITLPGSGADLKAYRETPLLNSKAEENDLPFGEYRIVRAYRNTTQLLVSVNTKIILYTDRDNRKDGEIHASAYSRLNQVHLNVPSIPQHEFNLAVEKVLRSGYAESTSTIPFAGCDTYISSLKNSKRYKSDGEYFIFLKSGGRDISLMTLNIFWKKLTLRNLYDENGKPSAFYSVYIDECYDLNIKKIIRDYGAVLKKAFND